MKKKHIYQKKLAKIVKQAFAEEKFLKAMTADEACEYLRIISKCLDI
ncbi:hypothetical protein QUB05_30750 [Microcoleus sp. F10-C6]